MRTDEDDGVDDVVGGKLADLIIGEVRAEERVGLDVVQMVRLRGGSVGGWGGRA